MGEMVWANEVRTSMLFNSTPENFRILDGENLSAISPRNFVISLSKSSITLTPVSMVVQYHRCMHDVSLKR